MSAMNGVATGENNKLKVVFVLSPLAMIDSCETWAVLQANTGHSLDPNPLDPL
jgi:hypothetical protein